MRVNFSQAGAGNYKLKFITALLRQFADANDIKFGDQLKNYVRFPQGAKALAAWSGSQGYKITYWCMESVKIDGEINWVGFGIDIDETCPLVISLKLKTL